MIEKTWQLIENRLYLHVYSTKSMYSLTYILMQVHVFLK